MFFISFPVEHLDSQVEERFLHPLPNHAYASHTASRISYHVHVFVVYYVVCFFPVLLLQVGSDNVAFVRTRSTMSICLLYGLVLLPCGISGKMTATLDLTTIFALLVVLMLSLCHATYHLFIKPPNHVSP